MAILKGVKINKDETFADGFRLGYKSIMGNSATVPAIRAHSIPAGKGAYLWGTASGIAAALRRKSEPEPSSN